MKNAKKVNVQQKRRGMRSRRGGDDDVIQSRKPRQIRLVPMVASSAKVTKWVRDCHLTRPSEGTLGMAPSMTASKASLWHRRDPSSLPARLLCVCRPVPPAMRHVAHTTLLCLCVLSDIARGVFVSHRDEPTRHN
jgi:hypothetical protein